MTMFSHKAQNISKIWCNFPQRGNAAWRSTAPVVGERPRKADSEPPAPSQNSRTSSVVNESSKKTVTSVGGESEQVTFFR
nr:unnamed protein product [Callosobruchus chinensis]